MKICVAHSSAVQPLRTRPYTSRVRVVGAEKRKRVRRERQGGDSSQRTSAPQHDSRSVGASPQLVGAAQQDAHALTNAGQKKKKKKQRQLSAEAKSETAPAAQQAAQLAGGHSAERNESPESRGSPSRATEQSSDAQAAGSPRAEAAQSETLAYTDEQLERTIFVGNVPVTSGRQHAASKLKALFKQCAATSRAPAACRRGHAPLSCTYRR